VSIPSETGSEGTVSAVGAGSASLVGWPFGVGAKVGAGRGSRGGVGEDVGVAVGGTTKGGGGGTTGWPVCAGAGVGVGVGVARLCGTSGTTGP